MRTLIASALAALAVVPNAGASIGGAPAFDGPTIAHPWTAPDFALFDQRDRLVRLSTLRGDAVLVTFLYTHCADVCPLTAERLNQALLALGRSRSRVRVLAVSVDPTGDTRAAIRRFARLHRLLPEMHYLTGPPEVLRAVWAAYGVGSKPRGAGRLDHTLYTLLLDRSGKGRVLYDATATPAAITHDVRLVLART